MTAPLGLPSTTTPPTAVRDSLFNCKVDPSGASWKTQRPSIPGRILSGRPCSRPRLLFSGTLAAPRVLSTRPNHRKAPQGESLPPRLSVRLPALVQLSLLRYRCPKRTLGQVRPIALRGQNWPCILPLASRIDGRGRTSLALRIRCQRRSATVTKPYSTSTTRPFAIASTRDAALSSRTHRLSCLRQLHPRR